MRPLFIPGLVIGTSILVGCGDPTAEGSGRAEALIYDTPAGAATVTGTLQGNIFASLSPDGTTWTDLGSPNGITVNLQSASSSTTVHGEQDAPTGSYRRVRLVFDGVTVRLLAGSTVGGTILENDVTIALGGSDDRVEVVVVVPDFTVEADPGVQRTIIFELSSQVWLTTAALQAGRVEDAEIQAAMTATTQVDPR